MSQELHRYFCREEFSVGTSSDVTRPMRQSLSWGELLSHHLDLSSIQTLTQHFFLLSKLPFPKIQLLNINMKNNIKFNSSTRLNSIVISECFTLLQETMKLLLQFSFSSISSCAAVMVKFVSGNTEGDTAFFQIYVFITAMKLLLSLPVVNSHTYSNLLKPSVLASVCSYSTHTQVKKMEKNLYFVLFFLLFFFFQIFILQLFSFIHSRIQRVFLNLHHLFFVQCFSFMNNYFPTFIFPVLYY